MSALTHDRLKEILGELKTIGLVDSNLSVTDRGYAFLTDLSTKVIPVLDRYGMWQR